MNTVSEEYSEIENIKNININQKIPSQDKKMLLKKIIFDNKENSTLEETNEILFIHEFRSPIHRFKINQLRM